MKPAVEVRERPILFSGPMVRAILEGRKTQTRRVAKDVPGTAGFVKQLDICPYGAPGDRLWVRETFQPLFADGKHVRDTDWETGEGYAVSYVATDGIKEYNDESRDEAFSTRCKPAIFMPRWASRLTLEVQEVRVQRVQEISHGDVAAEGLIGYENSLLEKQIGPTVSQFRELWDSINLKRGFGWDSNPWVWCVTFKRLEIANQ